MASGERRMRRNSMKYPPLFSDLDPLNNQTPDPTAQPHCVETSGPVVTMATKNISSKIKDIKSKSVLIQSGSPAVYRLKPKKEDFGTLRRMTLGEKNLNKTNRTILLVGETGAGKSTLVNTLVNYTMGVKWEDDVWFQIVEEENRSQSKSQTSDVIVYQIFGFEDQTLPYSLTIIDTPGYGDTRGTELDDIVSERLLDLFRSEDGVHEINVVGLVMKASDNRLSDRLMYIFDSVVSLFGKNIEKSIVALITHSDGLTPKNVLKTLEDANIKCAEDEKNEPVHFLFNNCQSEQRTERQKAVLKGTWDLTKGEMGLFTNFLEKTSSQKLVKTVHVLNERMRLKACIENLQERIHFTELKQRELEQTKEALKKHEEEMKKNEMFTVEVNEVKKVKEDVREKRWWALWLNCGGAVTCNVCKENCHYPCTLALSAKSCEIMKGGCCTVCEGKCPASDHVKESKIYVSKIEKVRKPVKEMKEKYLKTKLSLLENLERKIQKLKAESNLWLEESFHHIVTLEKIALNVDSVSTLVHLDFLIEKMKEKGDKEKVQKLEEMKRRVETDKGVLAALQYRLSKLTAAGGAFRSMMK